MKAESGNVGIGTTSPGAKLEVSGVSLGTTAGDTSNLLTLKNSNGNVKESSKIADFLKQDQVEVVENVN